MKTLTKDARGFIDGVTKYIQKDRTSEAVFPKVQNFFSKVTFQAKKERSATITTVVVLTQAEKSSLEKILTKLLGHEVECEYKTDSALLGGMKVQVADWVVDSSLQTQLITLTHSLKSI